MERLFRIIFWIFILGGFTLLITGSDRLPDFYNPGYMAGAAFASALAIFTPTWIFKTNDPKKKNARLRLQLVILLVLILNGAGALGLYKLYLVGFEYDKLVHFLIPLILVLGAVYFRMIWYGRDLSSALKWSLSVILVGAIGWEFYELFFDALLGTAMFGAYGDAVIKDTILDFAMNILGAVMAVLVIIFYKINKVEKK